ncbi:MAG: hypothetical protein WBF39_04910, partial [Planococcus donghaensis]
MPISNLNYFENNINQKDFYDFLEKTVNGYLDTKNQEYLNLVEAYLLKYSVYERFNTYCYIFRDFNNNRTQKFSKKQIEVIQIVLERILNRESRHFCKKGNGNLLYLYILYCWDTIKIDKNKLDLISVGANTLEEYRHKFLFRKIQGSVDRDIFLNSFMKNFDDSIFNISSILIAFSLYLDSNQVVKEKYFYQLISRNKYIKAINTDSSYNNSMASMMLKQLDFNKPFQTSPPRCLEKRCAKKVAVLISGQFRDMSEDVIRICEDLKIKYNAHVFLSTWDNKGASVIRFGEMRGLDSTTKIALKNTLKTNDISEKIFQETYMPLIDDSFSLKDVENLDFLTGVEIEDHQISTRLQTNQHRMLYKVNKAYKLSKCYSDYDVYIRIRPDLIFESQFSIDSIIENIQDNEIFTSDIRMLEAQGLRIDDNFAIASS